MKKVLSVFMAAILLVMAGCGAGNGGSGATSDPFKDMELQTIMEEIYAGTSVEIPSLEYTQVTAENEEYYLGVAGLDYSEALASEPMISAIAYSVVLVRMNNAADVEAAKTAIKDGVNPAKWICVQVDEQNVYVESAGNVILLAMSNDYAAEIVESFRTLAQSK